MKKNHTSLTLIKSIACCLSLQMLQGCCVTGSTLRTAQILNKNQVEFSGGIVHNHMGDPTQVVIAAYGLNRHIEIEGRWEDEYVSLTPRIQLLRANKHGMDCLAFGEIGYDNDMGLLGGPGMMFGKRFSHFSPYAAYRYRFWKRTGLMGLLGGSAQYIKLGTRYYFSPLLKDRKHSSDWFIGAECGPTIVDGDVIFECAVNFGFHL